LLDDIGDGKGLACAGCAKEHLVLVALFDAGDQFGNRVRLISGGLIGGVKFELHSVIVLFLGFFSSPH